jgi:hypothetical protein
MLEELGEGWKSELKCSKDHELCGEKILTLRNKRSMTFTEIYRSQ